MNEHYFEQRVNTPDGVEQVEQSMTSPIVINSDQFSPVEATLVHEALMGGTIIDIDPMDTSIVDVTPIDLTNVQESPIDTNIRSLAALLDQDVSEHLRTRWNEIQGRFVDEPRSAVEQADALVSEVVEKITRMFANEHSLLEGQWKQGSDVSTEDLRKSLQHYRSFFNRLVV